MSNWLISVPVWGAAYVEMFVRVAAPALLVAVRRLREPVKFIIHTDMPDRVRGALADQDIEFRSVGRKPLYVVLQESHANVVKSAAVGDRVVLLNADLVVSGNLLLRCAEHFGANQQVVVLLGIRTVSDLKAQPPAGAASRDLLLWAWAHRHRIIRDLEYPSGGSMLPTNIFWSVGESVVARGFHLHPAAIIKQATTNFQSTIDGDLLDCFPRESIHVVVSPDDCSMLEVSPPERRFPVRTGRMSPDIIAASMVTRASATHRWLFEHRIVVCGSGDEVKDDYEVARACLARMSGSSFGRRAR